MLGSLQTHNPKGSNGLRLHWARSAMPYIVVLTGIVGWIDGDELSLTVRAMTTFSVLWVFFDLMIRFSDLKLRQAKKRMLELESEISAELSRQTELSKEK